MDIRKLHIEYFHVKYFNICIETFVFICVTIGNINFCLLTEFPTNVLEMTAVANIFDVNGDGFIDYYEFVSALHPSRDPYRRTVDIDQINEEVRALLLSETLLK